MDKNQNIKGITQLFLYFTCYFAFYGALKLIGFIYKVGCEVINGLFSVPGASAGFSESIQGYPEFIYFIGNCGFFLFHMIFTQRKKYAVAFISYNFQIISGIA